MKLIYQINLAFGLLLLIVLSATAVIIHFVLLDHFVGTQKKELQAMGQMIKSTVAAEARFYPQTDISVTTRPLTMAVASPLVNVEAIVSDKEGNILQAHDSIQRELMGSGVASSYSTMETVNLQKIWDGSDDRYLVEVSELPQGTLTLLTPMNEIKAIEKALLSRFLIVLCLAGALVFLISLLITRKLIHPLMRLREELKKVKNRQFADVQIVKAGGEIGVVAKTVHELAEELDRYNRVQKQFFQNASHELKTPLMSISGYAEGIRDGVLEGERAAKGLDIILSESGRMNKIVTEMTLLAKLDSEEDSFQSSEVTVKDLITETIERINPLLTAKRLQLRVSYPDRDHARLSVHADRDKLLQALLNIVSNATRYARQTISIKIKFNKGKVEIAVADDGPGIADDITPYLFHRFMKGKDGESGLGLAIARAIVERCGGMISAGNRKEGGAVIAIQLPGL